MAPTTVAVDIGGTGIRAVQFKPGKHGPTVKKAGYVPLPVGAVEGGEIRNVDAVATALRTLWSDTKFGSKRVVFGVANSNVLVRIKTLPWDYEDDFRASLPYREGVIDDLPFSEDQVILDYHNLHEVTENAGDGSLRKEKVILLVAAERAMIETYLDTFRQAGLTPIGVDLSPFALIRSVNPVVAAERRDVDTVEVVIDMGLDITTVILHQDGQPRFVRIVNGQGGRHLNSALVRRFGWTEEEAENAKRDLGLVGGVEADGSQHPAQEVINHVVSEFISEIRTSIDYFLGANEHVEGVSRVVLTGGGAQMKGLAERISSELRVSVEIADPGHVVSPSRPLATPGGIDASQLSVAYGLTIGA